MTAISKVNAIFFGVLTALKRNTLSSRLTIRLCLETSVDILNVIFSLVCVSRNKILFITIVYGWRQISISNVINQSERVYLFSTFNSYYTWISDTERNSRILAEVGQWWHYFIVEDLLAGLRVRQHQSPHYVASRCYRLIRVSHLPGASAEEASKLRQHLFCYVGDIRNI